MASALRNDSNYSVTFKNYSSIPGYVCIFQQDENIGVPAFSLAWLTKECKPLSQVELNWTVNYSFVWAYMRELMPGVIFQPSQIRPADLSSTNLITLTNNPTGCEFINQTAGPESGRLYINKDQTIPINTISVGIGMSGHGTFAVNAQPNINLQFTPHPEYWICFGSYRQGEVLDVARITNPAQIKFPANNYAMTAILNMDNTWTMIASSKAN